jgi:hypothetical protein
MKRSSIFFAAALAVLTLVFSYPASAQELRVHVPTSGQSERATDAITRARHALIDYLAACTAHDSDGIARATTGAAVIEYALDEPGKYLSVDLHTTTGCWGSVPQSTAETGASDLWIFPTPDPDTTFVHFVVAANEKSSGRKSEYLALIEMSGDRIAKIRDFPGAL